MRLKRIRSRRKINSINFSAMPAYSGGLGSDLIAKLQGDETSLEEWSLEDMYEALNSQVHLLR